MAKKSSSTSKKLEDLVLDSENEKLQQTVSKPTTKKEDENRPIAFNFAHMSDLHIGAHGDPILRDIELETLRYAIDVCLEKKIAFLIIAGDIYDSNLPNLEIVNRSLKEFMRLREKDIPIYYVYGSHDFAVSQTSMINILDSANVFTKVSIGKMENEVLKLGFVVDQKTRVKFAGISGRQTNLERESFSRLDLNSLEEEPGFKIFVYHTAIDEFKPRSLAKIESLPLSLFPKNFAYYAGGHIHKKLEYESEFHKLIRNPGPIFAGRPQDLEDIAKGESRGFYLVQVAGSVEDYTIRNIEFIGTLRNEFLFQEYKADYKSSTTVSTELMNLCKEAVVEDKIVVFKVSGILTGGKTSDINFAILRKILMERGAKYVSISHHGLKIKEIAASNTTGMKKEEIEQSLFQEHIDDIKVDIPILKGMNGVTTALQLLNVVRQGPGENENITDYQERIIKEGKQLIKAGDLVNDN